MISITRQTSLFAPLLLILTIAASIVRLYLNPFAIEIAQCSLLPLWWECVVAALMLFIASFVVNRAAVKVGLFGGFSALPVSMFGFISCAIFLSPDILTAAAASLTTAFGTMFLIRSVQFHNDKESLFTSALLFGTSAVIYPPSITLVAVLLLAIFIIPLSFRQIVIAFTGYLIPLVGVSYVGWYMGSEITAVPLNIYNTLVSNTNPLLSLESLPLCAAAILLVLTLILLYGIMVGAYHRYSLLVPVRKTVHLIIWMSLITSATLLIPGSGITMLPVAAVPTAVLSAFSLDRMTPRWANIFYGVLIIAILLHLLFY